MSCKHLLKERVIETVNAASVGQKDVDFLIRGGDVISLLFAMGLLRKRQEVLFYNESSEEGRWQNVHNWGELEIRHLELLGEKIESEALSKIRTFLSPAHLNYSIGDKRLRLTDDPWENFFNLYRKFPKWFDQSKRPQFNPRDLLKLDFRQKFNEEFLRGLNRVAENCFRYRQLENLTVALFETHMPDFFLHLAESIIHIFRQESVENIEVSKLSLEEKSFILGLRFFTQHHLDLKWGKVEVYHFLISLLAPRYHLDEQGLLKVLQKEFCRFGGFWGDPEIFNAPPFFHQGHTLQTQNQEYKANFCVAFINAMTFKKQASSLSILDFNNAHSDHLIQLRTKLSMDECQSWTSETFHQEDWFFHVEPDLLGGDLAMWLIMPNPKENVLDVLTWVRYAECLDPQYFSNRALKILQQMGVFKREANPTQIDFQKTGGLAYLHQFEPKALNFELHLPQRLPYVAGGGPEAKRNKEGFYLGKRRGSLMGTFGAILEIKDVTYWAEKKQ